MKTLITGATGYIGRHLTERLYASGQSIRVLARETSDCSAFGTFQGIEIFRGDITDEKSLSGVEEGVGRVYHLAGVLPYMKGLKEKDYFDVNAAGSLNVIKRFAGSGLTRFCFVTSTASLGAISKDIVTEDDFHPPLEAYGKSKHGAEQAVTKFSEENSIPLVTARLTHTYGPGETRDLYRMIKMMKKGIFPQIGASPNLYPAVYIDDAVDGIIKVMEKGKPGETYIITDKESHDTKDIRRYALEHLGIKKQRYPVLPKSFLLIICAFFDMINKKTGIKFPASGKNIQFLTAARTFSIEKAAKELGYEPKVSLEEGLKLTIDYYIKEGLL